MLRLLRLLITGSWHEHEWEIIKEINVYVNPRDEMPESRRFILQCSICGNVKRKRC